MNCGYFPQANSAETWTCGKVCINGSKYLPDSSDALDNPIHQSLTELVGTRLKVCERGPSKSHREETPELKKSNKSETVSKTINCDVIMGFIIISVMGLLEIQA